MIHLFCFLLTIFLCHRATALNFHTSCANFAAKGDVTEKLVLAADNAQRIANNAWRQRMGSPSGRVPFHNVAFHAQYNFSTNSPLYIPLACFPCALDFET